MSALVKVFRCGPWRDVCRARSERPALENLPMWKPRGSGRGLWRKCGSQDLTLGLARLVGAVAEAEYRAAIL